MIRVDILDFYDKKVQRVYSNTLMRKTNPDYVIWENNNDSVPSFAASLKKKDNDFFFEMSGYKHKNLHVDK